MWLLPPQAVQGSLYWCLWSLLAGRPRLGDLDWLRLSLGALRRDERAGEGDLVVLRRRFDRAWCGDRVRVWRRDECAGRGDLVQLRLRSVGHLLVLCFPFVLFFLFFFFFPFS